MSEKKKVKSVGRKLTVESAIQFLIKNCGAKRTAVVKEINGIEYPQEYLKVKSLSNLGGGCYDYLRKQHIDLITVLEV
jgi:hypothetical protein